MPRTLDRLGKKLPSLQGGWGWLAGCSKTCLKPLILKGLGSIMGSPHEDSGWWVQVVWGSAGSVAGRLAVCQGQIPLSSGPPRTALKAYLKPSISTTFGHWWLQGQYSSIRRPSQNRPENLSQTADFDHFRALVAPRPDSSIRRPSQNRPENQAQTIDFDHFRALAAPRPHFSIRGPPRTALKTYLKPLISTTFGP